MATNTKKPIVKSSKKVQSASKQKKVATSPNDSQFIRALVLMFTLLCLAFALTAHNVYGR